MTQDVRDALETWFEQYEIDRQLHDVPPHAVYAVTVDGRRAVCKVDRGETADVGSEAAAMAHVDRDSVAEARAYLDDVGWAQPADEVLALLDDRPGLFAGAGAPVLCHGNLLPDHVGFERDAAGDPVSVAAVVDFEHALVAPPEYDLWRTALPVFFRGSPTPDPAYEAFRDGYGSVRSLPHGVERRRDAWVLVTLVSYFVALDVQNRGIGPDERPQAEGMAEKTTELVIALRDR